MSELPSAPVKPGDVLAGKYRIERLLGAGAMGVVVVAMHMQLDQRVAIKFLLREILDNADAVRRFSREAKAAARIRSEHVVRVLDVSTLEGGEPYMVMEYLEGEDLYQMVSRGGPLPVGEAIEYVLQALEAVCEAHLAGIVHRDLKPSNLFIARRPDGSPVVKVLDFGISKLTTVEQQAMTNTQAMLGSPLYMAPEQMRATRDVDRRADIWSLGVILYQLLTGGLPFVADNMAQLIATVMYEPTPLPSGARADLPPEIDAIVTRCLEKDFQRRFSDVGELAAALAPLAPPSARISIDRIERMLRSSGTPVPRAADASPGASKPNLPVARAVNEAAAVGAPAELAASGPVSQAWQATHGSRPRDERRTRLAVIAGGAGLLAIAGVLVAVMSARRASPPAAPTEPAAAAAPPAAVSLVEPPEAPPVASAPAAAPSQEPEAAASVSAPAHPPKPAPATSSRPAPASSGAPPPKPAASTPPPAPAPTSEFGGRH